MKMTRMTASVVAAGALLCAATGALAQENPALRPEQWMILGTSSEVRPGVAYALMNTETGKVLRDADPRYGISLGWERDRTKRAFTFQRAGPGTQPITFGERIAISVGGRGYLRLQAREYGINLVWSPTPAYEWEITGGAHGAAVPVATSTRPGADRRVRLFNAARGDYLMLYDPREYGINLGWYAEVVEALAAASYPPLPFPPEFRSASGEPGQIVLSGTATKVEVFHGGVHDELDWHIFIALDPATRSKLFKHLLEHAPATQRANRVSGPNQPPRYLPLREHQLDTVVTEWMVLDAYDRGVDDRFYSADVTRALGLSSRSAWNHSVDAGNKPVLAWSGGSVTPDAAIVGRAHVYLQGPLVNDAGHGFKLEIHPLDSFAYALDDAGNAIGLAPSDPAWPADVLTWRVAVFSNSSMHRINGAAYVKKPRTTTWYLPLPRSARQGLPPDVTVTFPPLTNGARSVGGWERRRPTPGDTYVEYGVMASSYAVETDPRDNQQKLRVTVRMDTPDVWGGMFLAEYRVTARR